MAVAAVIMRLSHIGKRYNYLTKCLEKRINLKSVFVE